MTIPAIDIAALTLFAVVLVAGVARGLSGFGTGMIVAPVAGALYGPKAALAIIVIIDSLPAIPVTLPALRIARWREVLPVALGMLLLFPAGVYLLSAGDAGVLRWLISISIFACVVVLYAGWRWRGLRNPAVSIGVGGVAGVLSGLASIPGPAVIAYWMAGGLPAVIVRANLLTLFFLGEFVSIGNLWFAGLFEPGVVGMGVMAAPVYFAGILAGWWAFGLASENAYRLVTFGLIVLSALLALPVFDRLFQGIAAAFGG
ncbi:sulfite exporter TauE/SafE family protein [Mesorhizobium sp. L-8-3]|uniref:sulfite exporter TauE/SafE family protein n=1 Tax=Mesorhizobium sp. L-8-3 TaxID=2744522 RepID=UPI001927870E|nr:sulfite exporter TauE/SafE family protein [Mesorhizobium sp. L-8-3]